MFPDSDNESDPPVKEKQTETLEDIPTKNTDFKKIRKVGKEGEHFNAEHFSSCYFKKGSANDEKKRNKRIPILKLTGGLKTKSFLNNNSKGMDEPMKAKCVTVELIKQTLCESHWQPVFPQ